MIAVSSEICWFGFVRITCKHPGPGMPPLISSNKASWSDWWRNVNKRVVAQLEQMEGFFQPMIFVVLWLPYGQQINQTQKFCCRCCLFSLFCFVLFLIRTWKNTYNSRGIEGQKPSAVAWYKLSFRTTKIDFSFTNLPIQIEYVLLQSCLCSLLLLTALQNNNRSKCLCRTVQTQLQGGVASFRHGLQKALRRFISCFCMCFSVSAGTTMVGLVNAVIAERCQLDLGEPSTETYLQNISVKCFRGGGRLLSQQQEILGEWQNWQCIFVLFVYYSFSEGLEGWCVYLLDFLE